MSKTSLDHLYPVGTSDSGNLQALENKVNNLSNVAAKTNLTNVFTTNQTINGVINSTSGFYTTTQNMTLAKTNNELEKKNYIVFEQDGGGYRNWCHLIMQHRFKKTGTTNWIERDIFKVVSHNENEGAFFVCENNLLSFESPTRIANVANPTGNNDVANKAYVDSKANNFTRIVEHNQTVNANTLVEWTIPAIENNKIHEFTVKLAVPSVDWTFTTKILVTSRTYKNMGPIISFSNDNNSLTENAKAKLWVDSGKVKLICNQAIASLVIYMRKFSI